MKKYYILAGAILALSISYHIYLSDLVNYLYAQHKFAEFRKIELNSIDDIVENKSQLLTLRNGRCEEARHTFVKIILMEDILISFLSGNSFINNIVKNSPTLTNTDMYSGDFVKLERLHRMFPETTKGVYDKLKKSPDAQDMVKKIEMLERTMNGKNKNLDFYSLAVSLNTMTCASSKLYLGMIGLDQDFSNTLKSIKDEIYISNIEKAKSALREGE